MFYVEFIHWDRSVPVETFRFLGRQSSAWREDSPDRLVVQLGRTLRLGPPPSYLAFWEIPSIQRLDDWESYFQSADSISNRRSQAIHRAITIERAGVYNCVFAGGTKPYPLCYLEFYKSLTEHRDVSQENLLYLLHRLGYLGSEAEAIAIWGCSTYRDVEALTLQNRASSLSPMTAGVYRDFGDEAV